MSVRKWHNHEPSFSLPFVHVVKQGGATQQAHIQWVDVNSNPQVGETNPTITKLAQRRYTVIPKMARQSVLMGFSGELVSVYANVGEMGGMYAHNSTRPLGVAVHYSPLQMSVTRHGVVVYTVPNAINGVEHRIDVLE